MNAIPMLARCFEAQYRSLDEYARLDLEVCQRRPGYRANMAPEGIHGYLAHLWYVDGPWAINMTSSQRALISIKDG